MWPFTNNWGDWKDISVEETLGHIRILQVRKNLKNGRKKMRVESIFFNGNNDPDTMNKIRKNIGYV